MPKRQSEKVPKSVEPVYASITALTDQVCEQYLNDEYAALARGLAAKLARKRPSPLLRGKPEIWACAIVYALGTVNFLFDESQDPHMSTDELCEAFGVSKSSGSNKARWIRDTLNMYQLDPDWCLPSLVDDNPMVWLLEVDGLIVDVRDMPQHIQELAYDQGLIPYIPADHQSRQG
jgi:hypothetical protein